RFTGPPLDVLVWTGIYLAFLFFWMPQNTFYRLFYLAPLITLLVAVLPRWPASHAGRLLPAVLLLWNFVFVAYPQSHPEYNAPLQFALSERNTWPPGTPIVFHNFHPDLWTISYFTPQAAWFS